MVFFSYLNGGNISLDEGLSRSKFSGNLVISIIIIILIICLNRVLYKLKFTKSIESNLYFLNNLKNMKDQKKCTLEHRHENLTHDDEISGKKNRRVHSNTPSNK